MTANTLDLEFILSKTFILVFFFSNLKLCQKLQKQEKLCFVFSCQKCQHELLLLYQQGFIYVENMTFFFASIKLILL